VFWSGQQQAGPARRDVLRSSQQPRSQQQPPTIVPTEQQKHDAPSDNRTRQHRRQPQQSAPPPSFPTARLFLRVAECRSTEVLIRGRYAAGEGQRQGFSVPATCVAPLPVPLPRRRPDDPAEETLPSPARRCEGRPGRWPQRQGQLVTCRR
jgi:hypothetical protein